MMMSFYKLNKDFEHLKKDTIVEKYDGHTYGCVSNRDDTIAIKYKNRFLEISKDMLDPITVSNRNCLCIII